MPSTHSEGWGHARNGRNGGIGNKIGSQEDLDQEEIYSEETFQG